MEFNFDSLLSQGMSIYNDIQTTKKNESARDYNLAMASLNNTTPPTQSRSLDTQVNRAVSTPVGGGMDNKTMMMIGGGVVGVLVLVLVLKK